MVDIGKCEMMFGWAGYTKDQIIKMAKQGKVCACDAHGGGKCKLTGNSYFPIGADVISGKSNDNRR